MNLGYKKWGFVTVAMASMVVFPAFAEAQTGEVSKRTPTGSSAESKAEISPKPASDPKVGLLPNLTATLADRAAQAFSRRDWKAARAAYQEMLQVDPQNALAWANLGAVEQQAGQTQAAIEAFETCVRFNPGLSQSWIALGLIHSGKGDRYKAISCLARALHEDPLDARAHNLMAIEAKNLGWKDTALIELQRAVELRPEYGLAHFNLATLYLEETPPSLGLARRHYDQAIALGEAKDELIERKLKE
jgi:tetratricopeptide (TPR) repeat protein